MVKQYMDKLFSYKSVLTLLIIIIIFFSIKDDGIIEYQKLSREHSELLFKMSNLSQQLYDLKQENILLKNNDDYIEKIAREKYFYLFPSETIINF